MKKIILSVLFCSAISFGNMQAQTTLTAGDIAIIGYNFDDADEIKFVALTDIAASTVIYFTDNGWTGSALSSSEGTYTWTAGAFVSKGTVVSATTSGMALSASGDQVFAYQGSAASPVFIYGLSTTAWIASGSITTTTSYKPSALTTGTTSLAFATEYDDGNYNVVSNTGNKSDLLLAISNTSNWSLTNTRITSWPAWTFTVGSYASEPSSNPTAVASSAVKTYSFTVSWTAASPAPAGYLVVRRKGSAPTSNPVDGTGYQPGDLIGNGTVAYSGTGTSFVQEGSIIANTSYYYKVYSFNGSGATANYRQTSPLSGTVTTPASGAGSYYSSINTGLNSFVSDLQSRVRSPYTKVTYANFDETNIAHFAFRDTTGGQDAVSCVYSGEIYTYTPPFTWYTSSPFSREHTWCHSWMPSYPSESVNEYSDQHHLFPVNQANANGVRSNHPLGEVVTVVSSYLDGRYGYDASGNLVYEPRDAHKGDAARALLYMSLRYDGVSGRNWKFNYLNSTTLPALSEDPQDVGVLLTWHATDAPDNYEIARNDYVHSIQQNRNPFVDHPEYVDFINWNDLSYNPAKTSFSAPDTTIYSDENYLLDVFPNPFQDHIEITAGFPESESVFLLVSDLTGRIIFSETLHARMGGNQWTIDTQSWLQGVYFIRLTAGDLTLHCKIIK